MVNTNKINTTKSTKKEVFVMNCILAYNRCWTVPIVGDPYRPRRTTQQRVYSSNFTIENLSGLKNYKNMNRTASLILLFSQVYHT